MLTPDAVAMRAHIDFLVGGFLDGCQDGRIELAWTDPEPNESGRFNLRHAETYELDDDSLDRLVAKACEVNSRPRTNVYIGAALRLPTTPAIGRATDDHFYAATAYWCDLDDQDANQRARERFNGAPPSLVVKTGAYPHSRHQMWWRLADPVTDAQRVRAACTGLATAFGGDGTVANPSRVMRLAGGIAWDQKPGRRPELTGIVTLKNPGLSAYIADHVERAFPPLYSIQHARQARVAPGPQAGIVRAKDGLGLPTGPVVDGREEFMRDVVCARLIDYCGRFGAAPTAEDLFEHAWESYANQTDLSRFGRGKQEFMAKCVSTVRRFEAGKIRGARNLDEAVASYQVKRQARQENVRHQAVDDGDDESRPAAEGILEFLNVREIKTLPDPRWLIDKMVVENALGFVFGPPGCGKTFVSLSMALSISVALGSWWGRSIQRSGAVIYISSEGQADLKFRLMAWEQAHKANADDAPFYLIRRTINFMKPEDVGILVATIAVIQELCGQDIAAVFVDTVSRVLPGADENLQKDMTLFIAACDAVRQRFGATVIGVHHTSRGGNLRGSTVFDGAGDFLAQIEREEGEELGTMTARKIKAAQDGWKQYFRMQPTPCGDIGGNSSVVAMPVFDDPKVVMAESWPSTQKSRDILEAMDKAWDAGEPWSIQPNATKLLYAPIVLVKQYGAPSIDAAKTLLSDWRHGDANLITIAVRDAKRHVSGIKVTGRIG